MSRKIKLWTKGVLVGVVASITLLWGTMIALAATAEISFSDPSAMVGNEVSVNVKVATTDGALGGADITLTYDPAVLEFVGGDNANGGAGTIRLLGTMDSDNTTSFRYNLKFKTLQAGNTAISVGSYEIYDKDTQAVSVSHVGSSNVKVTPPATYSTEAKLSSLTISPGSLSPAFSPDVTAYTASVGGDVDKVAISAVAKDSKAKVVTSGSSNLKTGQNKVTCKVTAEDGQTVKTYTITVTKAEGSVEPDPEPDQQPEETLPVTATEIGVDVSGAAYQLVSSFDETNLPEGFEATTITYMDSQIMAGKGVNKDLTLVLLANQDGNEFFIYDEASGGFTPFVSLDVAEKSIIILPKADDIEIPGGYVANDEIDVNGHTVQGWVLAGTPQAEYCIFYGMNKDGEKGLYRFDRSEMTIQRFFNDLNDTAVEYTPKYQSVAQKYNDLVDEYQFSRYIIIALIVVSLILFVLTIVLLLRRRSDRGGYDRGYHNQSRSHEPDRRGEEMTPVKRRAMQREQERGYGEPDFEDLDLDLDDHQPAPAPVPAVREQQEVSGHADIDQRLAALKENRMSSSRGLSKPLQAEDEDDFEFLDLDD